MNISNILLGRIKAYIDALGYRSFAALKTSRPWGIPMWGKEYGPEKKRRLKNVKAKRWPIYISQNLAVTKLAR
jgi:hypothetical protein